MPLSVATLNVNGLRSALRKGLLGWLEEKAPDILLLQEVRAAPMPEVFSPLGYQSLWHPAVKPGYSGVALASRWPLEGVQVGFGDPQIDAEGRLISAVALGVRFASVYLPSGSGGEARQHFKERVMADFTRWVSGQLRLGAPLVLGGDFNVAHTERDIKNWRGNLQNSGFLPRERQWLSELLGLGLRDHHREALGERSEYTWWSQRAGAYQRDVGWRIDYLLSNAEMGGVWVDRPARLSDHAPLLGTLYGVDPA